MPDEKQWRLAQSRLDALRNNIPNSIDEERVKEYHFIVEALEAGSGKDLAAFRIPDNEMKPGVAGAWKGTRRKPGRVTYIKKRYCDDGFFRRQVEALSSYVQTVAPPSRKMAYDPDYHALTDMPDGSPKPDDSARRLRVFLCHSSGDKPAVRDLYHKLSNDGFDPWLDEEDLLPGQEWREEIPQAVQNSDVVVVCLSQASVTKEGYVQKEIKYALDVADEKPQGTIFVIPAKLEEGATVPYRLKQWHWANLWREDGYDQLVRALTLRATKIGINPPPAEAKGGVAPVVAAQPAAALRREPSPLTLDLVCRRGPNQEQIFVARLTNVGPARVNEYQLDVEFPKALLNPNSQWSIERPEAATPTHRVFRVTETNMGRALLPRDSVPAEIQFQKKAEHMDDKVIATVFLGSYPPQTVEKTIAELLATEIG
jgi:hypothetical protein